MKEVEEFRKCCEIFCV